jgi:hypothetical protein
MPNPRDFLIAFNLLKNTDVGHKCVLSKINIKHVVVVPYRTYTFPLSIEIKSEILKSSSSVLEKFKEHVSGHKIINSQYGNPYDCYIDSISIKLTSTQKRVDQIPKDYPKTYIVSATGHGDRILKHAT